MSEWKRQWQVERGIETLDLGTVTLTVEKFGPEEYLWTVRAGRRTFQGTAPDLDRGKDLSTIEACRVLRAALQQLGDK